MTRKIWNTEHQSSDLTMLRERDLALRWQTSLRTLQRWRSERYGPPYIRLRGAIRYRLADILDFEERHRGGVAIE